MDERRFRQNAEYLFGGLTYKEAISIYSALSPEKRKELKPYYEAFRIFYGGRYFPNEQIILNSEEQKQNESSSQYDEEEYNYEEEFEEEYENEGDDDEEYEEEEYDEEYDEEDESDDSDKEEDNDADNGENEEENGDGVEDHSDGDNGPDPQNKEGENKGQHGEEKGTKNKDSDTDSSGNKDTTDKSEEESDLENWHPTSVEVELEDVDINKSLAQRIASALRKDKGGIYTFPTNITDYKRFVINVVTQKDPSMAKKEDEGNRPIVVWADTSGSCEKIASESTELFTKVSELGVSGADIYCITSPNLEHPFIYGNYLFGHLKGKLHKTGTIFENIIYQSTIRDRPEETVVALGKRYAIGFYKNSAHKVYKNGKELSDKEYIKMFKEAEKTYLEYALYIDRNDAVESIYHEKISTYGYPYYHVKPENMAFARMVTKGLNASKLFAITDTDGFGTLMEAAQYVDAVWALSYAAPSAPYFYMHENAFNIFAKEKHLYAISPDNGKKSYDKDAWIINRMAALTLKVIMRLDVAKYYNKNKWGYSSDDLSDETEMITGVENSSGIEKNLCADRTMNHMGGMPLSKKITNYMYWMPMWSSSAFAHYAYATYPMTHHIGAYDIRIDVEKIPIKRNRKKIKPLHWVGSPYSVYSYPVIFDLNNITAAIEYSTSQKHQKDKAEMKALVIRYIENLREHMFDLFMKNPRTVYSPKITLPHINRLKDYKRNIKYLNAAGYQAFLEYYLGDIYSVVAGVAYDLFMQENFYKEIHKFSWLKDDPLANTNAVFSKKPIKSIIKKEHKDAIDLYVNLISQNVYALYEAIAIVTLEYALTQMKMSFTPKYIDEKYVKQYTHRAIGKYAKESMFAKDGCDMIHIGGSEAYLYGVDARHFINHWERIELE